MTIKKKASLVLAGMMILVGAFTGCQKEEVAPEVEPVATEVTEAVEPAESTEVTEEAAIEPEIEEISLSDWDGSWNNMGAYLDDEELQEAFAELAEREDSSAEEVKENYQKRRHVDFDGLIIEGNKATLLDGFEDDGGQLIEEVEYEYKETITVKHGNFDTQWYNFEATGDAEYKTLLMMPVHGEELLTHFHLRYGNDLDELLAMEDWYPTFVKPNSTYEQLYGEITE